MKKEKLIIEEITETLNFDLPVLGYDPSLGGWASVTGQKVSVSLRIVSPEKLAKFLSKYVDIKAEDLVE